MVYRALQEARQQSLFYLGNRGSSPTDRIDLTDLDVVIVSEAWAASARDHRRRRS